jgi:nucleoside-diphosphate-sugar epimerase
MKILMTGGTGFIGPRLAARLSGTDVLSGARRKSLLRSDRNHSIGRKLCIDDSSCWARIELVGKSVSDMARVIFFKREDA